jgi:hypothetical protein
MLGAFDSPHHTGVLIIASKLGDVAFSGLNLPLEISICTHKQVFISMEHCSAPRTEWLALGRASKWAIAMDGTTYRALLRGVLLSRRECEAGNAEMAQATMRSTRPLSLPTPVRTASTMSTVVSRPRTWASSHAQYLAARRRSRRP